MSAGRARLRSRLAACAAVVAWLALLAAPVSPAAAATPSVTAPVATVDFLERIQFRGEAVLTADVAHAEIVLEIQGSERAFVADVGAAQAGTETLAYDFETPGGSIMPNTTIRARFRLTMADGTRVLGPATSVTYEDPRFDWSTLAGDFVTVHWTEGGMAFGRRAVRIADDAVREVGDLLGVIESEPIDFYVYADRDAFLDVLGAASRENVGGQAHPDIRTLFANISPGEIDDPWVGVVIPHELTHLVFDTAVANPNHYPPRWLNEGVAVYLSEGFTAGDRAAVDAAVDDRSLMPLGALSGQFPTTADQFRLAYSESVSAVDFLVSEHGQPAMVDLVRSYADGVTDDEAFEAATGTDVAAFEAAWLEDLGADAPVPYGPVDAPAGPVPAGWTGGGEVPGPIQTGSPEPTSRSASPGRDAGGDATAVLVGLLVAGLATIGVGGWLLRRNRAALAVPVTAAEAAVPLAPSEAAVPLAPPEAPPAQPDPPPAPDAPPAPAVDGGDDQRP
jgi:hypothetical protein